MAAALYRHARRTSFPNVKPPQGSFELGPGYLQHQDTTLAKGQKKSSREAKKPKATKKPEPTSGSSTVLPPRPPPTKGGAK